MCTLGPSPAIPSGLGHKYPKRAGVGVVLASFGMTTRAIFPKQVCHKLLGSEKQAVIGANHWWGFALHRELPTAHGPGQVHREGRKPSCANPEPASPWRQEGTGKSTEPPRCPPRLRAKTGHRVRGCLQLVGTGFDFADSQ